MQRLGQSARITRWARRCESWGRSDRAREHRADAGKSGMRDGGRGALPDTRGLGRGEGWEVVTQSVGYGVQRCEKPSFHWRVNDRNVTDVIKCRTIWDHSKKKKVHVFLNANENDKTLGQLQEKRLLTKIMYNAGKFLKVHL